MDNKAEQMTIDPAKPAGSFPHDPVFPLPDFLPTGGGQFVEEPLRHTPVIATCDVVVLGGGPAGACAAAAPARAGRHVLLVERHGFLGGMATAANVNIWHSLYGTDGQTQVIGGLPEEIIRRLQRRGAVRNKADDGETGPWEVCTETAKLVFDDLVIGSGVRLLFHTWLADVIAQDRRLSAVIVENKSGRGAILADVFIDCTGDADVARRAGHATQLGDPQGRCQPPTLCFRVSGRAPGAKGLHELQPELYRGPMDYNQEHYPCFLWGTRGNWSDADHMFAGTRVLGINASDARDFTRAEIEARYQMRWVLDQVRGHKGWERVYLTDIAAQIGVRESHRIQADHQVTRDEILHGRRFEDVIAQGTYPIDIHNPDGPGITFEYLDGRRVTIHGDGAPTRERWDGEAQNAPLRDTLCWQVPYRSLLPRELDNLLVAGRCIGAEHDAAGAIRVMINAMQFGQAAGMAAALVGAHGDVRRIDVRQLQQALVRAGAPLPTMAVE